MADTYYTPFEREIASRLSSKRRTDRMKEIEHALDYSRLSRDQIKNLQVELARLRKG